MRQIYIEINVFNMILSMCFVNVLSIQYQQNRKNENFSASADNTASLSNKNENLQETWQPMTKNNWILLKTNARNHANEEILTKNPEKNYRKSQMNRKSYSHTPTQLNKYNYWHKEQQAHQLRSSTNYFIYNHSNATGNYQQPKATEVKLIEPYIVTISKMRAHTNTQPENTEAILSQRTITHGTANDIDGNAAMPPYVSAIKLTKDLVSNVDATLKTQFLPDIKKEEKKMENSLLRSTIVADTLDVDNDNTHEEQYESNIDKMKTNGAYFNEIFQPLQLTLDKFISFCDMAKSFIGQVDGSYNEENIVANNVLDDNDEYNSDNNSKPFGNKITASVSRDEDQVHHSLSVESSLIRAQRRENNELNSTETGRGIKKFKKKLQKFMLPLLLAYKLKFLTLIPVFIGGLTLLVGTTGLAGFFFALFTAVMSLKSTDSSRKSVIVSKI